MPKATIELLSDKLLGWCEVEIAGHPVYDDDVDGATLTDACNDMLVSCSKLSLNTFVAQGYASLNMLLAHH